MVHRRLVPIWLMETVCSSDGSQEWGTVLCSQPEAIRKARPLGTQEMHADWKRPSQMGSQSLAFFAFTGFSQKIRCSRSSCSFTPSAHQSSVSPIYPFYLCENKILLWTVHSDSQGSFTCMVSFALLNNPKAEDHFHFTGKNLKLIDYHLPKVIQRKKKMFNMTPKHFMLEPLQTSSPSPSPHLNLPLLSLSSSHIGLPSFLQMC